METKYANFDFEKSLSRIDEILNASSDEYKETDAIPARTNLTFTNGYYVNCTVLFIDICGSSNMTEEQKRPVLAKIYRSFISEMVALLNGNNNCKEVNIHGDCVWGVFNICYKQDIDEVVALSAKVNSLVLAINKKLAKKKYLTYQIGVGIDYGRALMIKAGYKESTINDVVWMGDVVNHACHLASFGNQSFYDETIMISDIIYENISDDLKKYFSYNSTHQCYHGSIINKEMEKITNQKI